MGNGVSTDQGNLPTYGKRDVRRAADTGQHDWSHLAKAPITNTLLTTANSYSYKPVARNESSGYAQNPLHTFPRNFPVDGEAADLLRTCWRAKSAQQVWETTRHRRHNGLLPAPNCCGLPADLLRGSRQLVTAYFLQGNWCNGFWPLQVIGSMGNRSFITDHRNTG